MLEFLGLTSVKYQKNYSKSETLDSSNACLNQCLKLIIVRTVWIRNADYYLYFLWLANCDILWRNI